MMSRDNDLLSIDFFWPLSQTRFLVLEPLLGSFIPGRLGTSLAACRDNNKHGGRVTRMVNANSSRGIDQVLPFAP